MASLGWPIQVDDHPDWTVVSLILYTLGGEIIDRPANAQGFVYQCYRQEPSTKGESAGGQKHKVDVCLESIEDFEYFPLGK